MSQKTTGKEAPVKIIGRKKEQELMRELIDSNRLEFIAVDGRRRVGKSYLIKNLMSSIPCVFFHVTGVQKGPLHIQLKELAKQIGKAFYQSLSIVS
jgi:AAA+ ATPase superfamily predicted ATPase